MTPTGKPDKAKQDDDRTTPGKPTDSASRQQTHENQGTQTGSGELDRKSAEQNPHGLPKPAGAK